VLYLFQTMCKRIRKRQKIFIGKYSLNLEGVVGGGGGGGGVVWGGGGGVDFYPHSIGGMLKKGTCP